MSLFDFLLDWRNPTRKWSADPSVPIVLDLDRHRLSDIGIGDRYERFAFLGRGRWGGATIAYPERGIHLWTDANGLVSGFSLFFGHPDEPREGQFSGTVRFQGDKLNLDCGRSEHEIQDRFGEPYWRDLDDNEVILFYEFAACEWQIEFGTDGRLKCWIICGDPLMADNEQRRFYGVTKPWPDDRALSKR
jgi:hypothetical protein